MITMTMALLIVDDDDVEDSDHHAGGDEWSKEWWPSSDWWFYKCAPSPPHSSINPSPLLPSSLLCGASSSSSPLSNQMDPVCLSYLSKHILPQPNWDPTWMHLLTWHDKFYYATRQYNTNTKWLRLTQRNRAQTAPPDCAQTWLKSDQRPLSSQTQSTFHHTTTS